MKSFNIGSLRNWRKIPLSELIAFEVPSNGFRAISFEIMAESPVSIRAISGDDAWLVGTGEGHFICKFSTDVETGVVVMPRDDHAGDPAVFIRTRMATQVIPASGNTSYTNIEPRPAGPSDEVRRMMQIMKINQQRREQHLLQEMDRRLKAASQSPAPAPGPAPAASAAPVIENENENEAGQE